MKFDELRNKYPEFIYEKYDIVEENDKYVFTFTFSITSLCEFKPVIKMPKTINSIDTELLNYMVFHIGLIELISYYKCTMSPKVIIKAGFLNEEQIKWFKKLYYLGLGELMYVNNIHVSEEDLMDIVVDSKRLFNIETSDYIGQGNMIAIGGGKDSNVTLHLLKGYDNTCFMINPKEVSIKCTEVAGYNSYYDIERILDKKLLDLNKQGYINGHTPFSSLVAFVSYLAAYLNGRKYIVLSNEASANEPTIPGTKINHQYSKTYEFESDFNNYVTKYFKINIKYFSMLRCLSEFQIGMLFSQYPEYHQIFKSCNVGSKSQPWVWCGKCAKCLFVYCILAPFLYKDKLVDIFGCDLFEDKDLLNIFIEEIGYSNKKPFECVGTSSEVRYSVSLLINKLGDNLPYLLKYYKDNYKLELDHDFRHDFNEENNIPEEFLNIVKNELNRVNEMIDNDR